LQDPDLTLLLDAADAAAVIAMKHFKSCVEVWEKGNDQGPVSAADLEIDTMLKARFSAARPEYGWLSEETEDDQARLTCDKTFIIDPIDGTRSFIDGNENFAVALAIADQGEVLHGVVAMPAKGLVYAASRGAGAHLNGEPITVGSRSKIKQARFLLSGSMQKHAYWRDGPPPFERHFRSSLAYRMSLVAQGRFDGMLTFRPTWEWDVAAGDIIAREAGAIVTDRSGQPLRFNQAVPQLDGALATNINLHGQMQNYLLRD